MSSRGPVDASRVWKAEVAGAGDPTPVDAPFAEAAADDGAPPRIPEVELSRVLGRGGMGTVYVGRAVELDRPVAVKVIHPELARHESFVRRFEREARALARLSHPGIVACYQVGRTAEGTRYLVLELVEGRDLLALVHEGGVLSESDALALVRQLAHALSYALDRGVIHRDVKPENILVSRASGPAVQAKLVDLGLAVFDSPRTRDLGITRTGEVMGSPLTVAPEQAETPDAVDHRADIYALGATLFFALTGRFPHEGTTPGQILARKLRDDVRDPRSLRADLRPDVARLVRWMLRAAPARRPRSYGQLLEALDRIEARARGPHRGRAGLVVGAALAGVAAAALVGAVVAGGRRAGSSESAPGAAPGEGERPAPSEPPAISWTAPERLFGNEADPFARWRRLPAESAWQPADEEGSCDGVAEGSSEVARLELDRLPAAPWRLRLAVYPRSAREVGVRLACSESPGEATLVSLQPLGDATELLRVARADGASRARPSVLTLARGERRRDLVIVAAPRGIWARMDGAADASGRAWAFAELAGDVRALGLFVRRGSASFGDAVLEVGPR